MDDWKKIDLCGASEIRKVVCVFHIWELYKTPCAKFKIKILEDINGEFTGVPNIAYKDSNGNVNWISGCGHDVTTALQNTLKSFMESLPNDLPHFGTAEELEKNFEWAAFQDF